MRIGRAATTHRASAAIARTGPPPLRPRRDPGARGLSGAGLSADRVDSASTPRIS